jgi:hypothetical protein
MAIVFSGFIFSTTTFAHGESGFYLPDSVQELQIQYRNINGLVVLPFIVHDSIQVNLILDSGSSNFILFGRKFRQLINSSARAIRFSGHGSGHQVQGFAIPGMSLKMDLIIGENIPMIVIPRRTFMGLEHVDGVIGLDIFQKFEVEIDPMRRIVSFRRAMTAELAGEYSRGSLRVDGHRPMLESTFTSRDGEHFTFRMLIDTGSSLGLMLFTDNQQNINPFDLKIIGSGFNGEIHAFQNWIQNFNCSGLSLREIPIHVTLISGTRPYASLGMDILKNYKTVINYCKGYIGFKKLER